MKANKPARGGKNSAVISCPAVEIVDSRLENSDGTFSFQKQCPYTNLLVHNYERCLSKGRVLPRFGHFGKNFVFLRKVNKM